MSLSIHPTALVGEGVVLGPGCSVGPFAIIEPGAVLGAGNQLGAASYVFGCVTLGDNNRLMRGASLGGEPQDKGYRQEPTRLEVGHGNYFGENITVHRGTAASGKTVVGDQNYLMVNVHIGHDCRLGSHIVMAPGVMVGGHGVVEDRANFGGGVAVHQFCRVGRLAMLGGLSRVTQDVLPFAMVNGDNSLVGLNRVGLKRQGHSLSATQPLKEAYRRFCRGRQDKQSLLDWMAAQPANPLLEEWRAFLEAPSKRGYARASGGRRGEAEA